MQTNVLEYLDVTAARYPNKVAFCDENKELTFSRLMLESESIGTELIRRGYYKQPVAVFLDKGCECISSFMGIAAAGCFYCPIDTEMPQARIQTILELLKPAAVITDRININKWSNVDSDAAILFFEECILQPSDKKALSHVRVSLTGMDPLYVLFTSGSTGIPKGVVIAHYSVIDYIDWVSEVFEVSEKDILGNQAPFYFDNSVLDIYCALRNGCSVYIVPKKKFLFPKDLIDYLNMNRINMIFWVPSMLCMVANSDILSVNVPEFLDKILFAGEVMPNKQLNMWRQALPFALYANLYGPTEITVDCTYYIVDREFQDEESLPIGLPCKNTNILVLNKENKPVQGNEIGELCVGGSCLSLGYYNNPDKTREVFVQNPLNSAYEEKIYRTGDLVHYNERGELIYVSRKDFQIKHMGYRIELGEIETAASSIGGTERVCCMYDAQNAQIILFYTGTIESVMLKKALKGLLPKYMMPNKYNKLEKMPLNLNDKIDRTYLKTLLV